MPSCLQQLGDASSPDPLETVTELRSYLAVVPDPRARRGIRHPWAALLTAAAAAVLAGAASITAIGEPYRPDHDLQLPCLFPFGSEICGRCEALEQTLAEAVRDKRAAAGLRSTAAGFAALTRELVRVAVLADQGESGLPPRATPRQAAAPHRPLQRPGRRADVRRRAAHAARTWDPGTQPPGPLALRPRLPAQARPLG
ncbi:transposase family protein [Streptomyces sp. NPDC017943]|uniref:transposase family protein n=1 Tax=Streptomyces sp. NPDC017943 TaxID=3365019 RepID=UPI0037AFA28C